MNQSRLTNVQRLEICRQKSLNPALKNKDLSAWVQQQYRLTVSLVTVGNILKKKQELEEMTPPSLFAKRPRISQHPQLDEALLFWVLQCESRRVAVTGSLIKAKAKKFSEQLGITEREFSNGWLQRFQQRNQLRCIKSHGESGSAETAGMEQAIPTLQNTIQDYQLSDIYNMDETGEYLYT
ncbi:hypothetical protein K3495_g13185 [Podosphaera aphanis]|nr:hypothetical protein K3495_g13185 [Podosphaera aphanis]